MANGWRDDTRSPWEEDRNRDRQRYSADEPFEGEDFDRDFADYGPFRGNYPRRYGSYSSNLPYGSERYISNQRSGQGGGYRRNGPGQYGSGDETGGYRSDRYGRGYGGSSRSQERGDFRRGAWGEWGEPSWGRPDYAGYSASEGRGQQRPLWDRTRDEVRSWMGDEEAGRRRESDEYRGGHYGRGPRGYARSDERIREDLNDRLTYDWRVDATDVEVKVSSGEVTLNGAVDSRQAKRCAEDIADGVSGVRHVQNNLRVRERSSGSSSEPPSTLTTGSTTQGKH
jgi:osmotically-inducible protein OsmY